ncbi:alanine dehydrogenase [Novimethylophilus kurashikiensis]|uniref:Alanine dehydrogenase n=1 Tax=Novimethylophilus kurashikiensis TaxID=1825523 RepID=A0A2R5FCQ9_9PROT|nr:alanine dehydrogenase [Novimethylophilus kurashikiensis]GBG15795.1 alanine dehydrogenase [Novimethylophilus kurashikiensis]
MKIGVPKEIKVREYRVGLVPANVHEIVKRGHAVWVEKNAGAGIGASDDAYRAAGATIVEDAEAIYAAADLIVKVKEPQRNERRMLKLGQILFTYLHLAPDPDQTRDLVTSGATCIGYETVTSPHGGLPLLAPMSEVAGRLAVQAGAYFLEEAHGGRGILLGGVPGVAPAKVVILGGGVVGAQAADVALGMGADVCVLDRNLDVLRRLQQQFGHSLKTVFSTHNTITQHCCEADLVIGSILVPGAEAPKLISRETVKQMQPGSVIVDVAIDQGGCCETSRPTTHDAPTYIVDGVIHYCVANMPGSVPRTSTYALNNATLPYVLALADKGLHALRDDPFLREGLNVYRGKVTNRAVAEALGYGFEDALTALDAIE